MKILARGYINIVQIPYTWTLAREYINIGDITKRASEVICCLHLSLSVLLIKIHPFPPRTKRGQVIRGHHCHRQLSLEKQINKYHLLYLTYFNIQYHRPININYLKSPWLSTKEAPEIKLSIFVINKHIYATNVGFIPSCF